MNGDGVGDLGRADHRWNIEIAFRRLCWADAHRLVREADVLCIAVGLGVQRDRPDPEHTARTQDAQRDFTPIGDHQFLDHRRI